MKFQPRHIVTSCITVALAIGLTYPAMHESQPLVLDGNMYTDLQLWEEGQSSDVILDTLREQAPFGQMGSTVSAEELQSYKVFRKAQALGIGEETLAELESLEGQIRRDSEDLLAHEFDQPRPIVEFEGSTAQELQHTLDWSYGSTVVLKQDVALDRTVDLPDGTLLDGAGHALVCELEGPALRVRDASNVFVRNLKIDGGADVGFAVADSQNIGLQQCEIGHMRQKAAIFAGNCRYILVQECTFEENEAGGLYLSGDVHQGLVADNVVANNKGTSNWMAGIVLTQSVGEDPLDIWAPFPDEKPFFPKRGSFEFMLETPHDIVLAGNTVTGNQSSGIYGDGPYRCMISDNTVEGNDKEGMCLDFGSIACYVHDNSFTDNGKRIRQDDRTLELDEVLEFGRLEDGSSAAKLPAVSLDNACYNVLENNTVQKNWGGGIKNVRTSLRNIIAGNDIMDCNEGGNDVFAFIGIELGNPPGPAESETLDFKPDLENLVIGNRVVGAHHLSVFLSEEAAGNVVLGNELRGGNLGNCVVISARENTVQRDFVSSVFNLARRILP